MSRRLKTVNQRLADAAAEAALLHDASQLVGLAIREDVGPGDITSQICLPEGKVHAAEIVARQRGVMAGLWVAGLVYDALGGAVTVDPLVNDGESFEPGCKLAAVHGPVDTILTGERTVLNFLQRLCGVATVTRQFVEAVAGTAATVCDTRKTTPGWRRLEKYAVLCGGGMNHRLGLFDQVLIKDNHLALVGQDIATVVAQARARVGPEVIIEVEVDTLDQLKAVLGLPVDMVLLDNMSPERMREAVALRNAARRDGRPLLEASGGITLETVRAAAETGVDRVSVGALTHSAPAVDIAMDVISTDRLTFPETVR